MSKKYKVVPENLKETFFEKILNLFQDLLEGKSSLQSVYDKIEDIWKVLSPRETSDIDKSAKILDPLSSSVILESANRRDFIANLPFVYNLKGTREIFKYICSLLGIEAELIPWYDERYLQFFNTPVPCSAVISVSGSALVDQREFDLFEKFVGVFQDVCLALSYIRSNRFEDNIDFTEQIGLDRNVYLCDDVVGFFNYLRLQAYNNLYVVYAPTNYIPGSTSSLYICNDTKLNLCESSIALCRPLECYGIPFALYDGTFLYAGHKVASNVSSIFILEGDAEAFGSYFIPYLKDAIQSSEKKKSFYLRSLKDVFDTQDDFKNDYQPKLVDTLTSQEDYKNWEQHTIGYYNGEFGHYGNEIYFDGDYTVPGTITYGEGQTFEITPEYEINNFVLPQ